MTALHSVAGIPEGSAGTEDLVNTVQILLDHGADLTFSTYQVMHNVVEDSNLEELFVNVASRPSLLLDEGGVCHVLITSTKPLAELTPTRPRLFMWNSSFVGV